MTTDLIMIRLRKLIAHEESARSIGSLAEAEAFATKISELLIEHKLEMAEVKEADDHDEERRETVDRELYNPQALDLPYNGKQRVAWMEQLAGSVARAHFCRIVVVPGSTSFWFVGTTTDRRVAGSVFAALVRGGIAACDHAYNEARRDPWSNTKGFRTSFFIGYANSVTKRLRALRATHDATQSTALVLANADSKVTKYMDAGAGFGKLHNTSRIGSTSNFNGGAHARGKAAGERANLGGTGALGGGSKGSIEGGSR